jgi:hypothetical protein
MSFQAPSPTAAEVQGLRGRCLQLEAELAAALNPTHTVTFVGSCEGWHSWSGAIGATSQVNVGNAAPTAHLRATTELTKWKTANPGAVIVSEEHTWTGLTPQPFSNSNMFMVPTVVIVVKYRLN